MITTTKSVFHIIENRDVPHACSAQTFRQHVHSKNSILAPATWDAAVVEHSRGSVRHGGVDASSDRPEKGAEAMQETGASIWLGSLPSDREPRTRGKPPTHPPARGETPQSSSDKTHLRGVGFGSQTEGGGARLTVVARLRLN
eukprot:9483009-Pyramimonas_sp.AAC.1